MRRSDNEARYQSGQIESTIEAVAELGQVTLQVFRAQRMKGAMMGHLDVAKHRVDPPEVGCPRSGTLPVAMAVCVQSASVTPRNQFSPSDTTAALGTR
jgi:hypothetical protein